MPSPFPGMDPYLEDPGGWSDVHHRFLAMISEVLNRDLRPGYSVRIKERLYLSDQDDPGRPVIDTRPWAFPRDSKRASTLVDERMPDVAEPVWMTPLFEEEIRERYLDVIHRESGESVAVIEIVRPANKVSGSYGRDSITAHRREVFHSSRHWVEIDLLRRGIPVTSKGIRPESEYHVLVSRAERRPRALLWPIRLSQRLPRVTIPLRSGDPDMEIDLQAVLDFGYDRAGYDRDIDYRKDPVPPLEGEWAAWADRLLKEKGLRPGSD